MTTIDKGVFSKTFLGVSVDFSRSSIAVGMNDILPTADVSFNFGGKQYFTSLGESNDKQQVKAIGSREIVGSVLIPASKLYRGATFPEVKISGYFEHISSDGSAPNAVIYHPLFLPFSVKNTTTFQSYTPPKQNNRDWNKLQ
jgi:hypothetical protein